MRISVSQGLVIMTLIAWGIWDLIALVSGDVTISQEITEFAYMSAAPALLFGLLGGHFFLNKMVSRFSKRKYDGGKVGYGKVGLAGKAGIGSVMGLSAWDVFGAMLDFWYPSMQIVSNDWYRPDMPLLIGLIMGRYMWATEVKK
jgi:hypothetical protein